MPFKSQAQRRYLYATHPEIAHRWSKESMGSGNSADKKGKTRLSIKSLLTGEYGEEQERKRLKPPNQITGPRG